MNGRRHRTVDTIERIRHDRLIPLNTWRQVPEEEPKMGGWHYFRFLHVLSGCPRAQEYQPEDFSTGNRRFSNKHGLSNTAYPTGRNSITGRSPYPVDLNTRQGVAAHHVGPTPGSLPIMCNLETDLFVFDRSITGLIYNRETASHHWRYSH